MPFISGVDGRYGFGRSYVAPIPLSGIGLSSNNPGSNGVHVYNSGNVTNGWYWIKTSMMSQARQVYCNMSDVGGGWMLISYNGNKQNANTNLAGQYYPVQWLGGQGTLSGQFAANAMDLWFHNGTYQCSSLMRVATTTPNAIPTVANSYIAHYVTYTSNQSSLTLSTGCGVQSTGIFASGGTLMGARWSSLKGYTILTSTYTTNADADWIYNTGTLFYWNPILPINGTSRSGSAADIGGWMRTIGKDSWGLSNVAVGASSGGNAFIGSTLAVFIK